MEEKKAAAACHKSAQNVSMQEKVSFKVKSCPFSINMMCDRGLSMKLLAIPQY